MTREIKDELVLAILFLGFRRLLESLVAAGANSAFPSPKAGALDPSSGTSLELMRPASLLSRKEDDDLLSLGCS